MIIRCEKEECDGRCNPNMFYMTSEILGEGGLIVYPTDTLYGIGGDATRPEISIEINRLKGAKEDKPISVAYSSVEHISEYVDLPPKALELARRFLPGPLTIVVDTPQGNIGIRVPDHPLAAGIIKNFGPITSTSVNIHGMDPVDDIDSALSLFGNKIQLYIDCGKSRMKTGTTVVKVNDKIEILREGAIGRDEILGKELH